MFCTFSYLKMPPIPEQSPVQTISVLSVPCSTKVMWPALKNTFTCILWPQRVPTPTLVVHIVPRLSSTKHTKPSHIYTYMYILICICVKLYATQPWDTGTLGSKWMQSEIDWCQIPTSILSCNYHFLYCYFKQMHYSASIWRLAQNRISI